jgi:predicted XRE-type DNA-binding protein
VSGEMTIERHDADHASVIDSSRNVFTDLGLPSSEEDMLKVHVSRAIASAIHRRKLTQVEAAEIIGVDQARVSNLLRGRLNGFSVERLFRYLLLLGQDVDIHISHKRKEKDKPGRIRVLAA